MSTRGTPPPCAGCAGVVSSSSPNTTTTAQRVAFSTPLQGRTFMCDPVTAAIVVGVTSVAGTAANVVPQSKAAKAQNTDIRAHQEVAREETRLSASAALFDKILFDPSEHAQIRTATGR